LAKKKKGKRRAERNREDETKEGYIYNYHDVFSVWDKVPGE